MGRIHSRSRRWISPIPVSEDRVAALADTLGLPDEVCRILIRRGIASPAEARSFLRPRLADLGSSLALPDVRPAVARIERALRLGETILVHGDYDADGMSAAALLTLAVRDLGGNVAPFVPHRTRDGYDLSEAGLRKAQDVGASLIVTADCGVTAVTAVREAKARGMDVVITDHHRPGPDLPAAEAIVDPMLGDRGHPFRELAGVGVAFKLMSALYEKCGAATPRLNQHLDLVAIGTVADQMPLTGENRILVRAGLRAMERSLKPGVRALLANAGVQQGQRVEAAHISYRVAPRLNSVGRMAEAATGLDLLLTSDPAEAGRLAAHLELQNSERRQTDMRVFQEVQERMRADFAEEDQIVVLWGDGWHPGVIGIVASRLVEKLHRPAVVISFDGEVGRGSGRSVDGFHLFNALQECEDLLVRFGGHRMAAGLTVQRHHVEVLAARLRELAARDLADREAVPEIRLDIELDLGRIGRDLLQWLDHLAPFGAGNPSPVLAVRGVRLARPSRVGTEGGHLRLTLQKGDVAVPAIAFGMGKRVQEARSLDRADVALEISENRWNGRREVQARVLDFRDAGA